MMLGQCGDRMSHCKVCHKWPALTQTSQLRLFVDQFSHAIEDIDLLGLQNSIEKRASSNGKACTLCYFFVFSRRNKAQGRIVQSDRVTRKSNASNVYVSN